MTLHEKGFKGDRDRAVLLSSLEAMYKTFRTPQRKRLSEVDRARMTNAQLYRHSKDLYNSATTRKANRLAVKAGIAVRDPLWQRLSRWAGRTFLDPHSERSELHSKTRMANRA